MALGRFAEARVAWRRLLKSKAMVSAKVDRTLDVRGKVCPYPTGDTRQALVEMRVGEVLEVVTDYYPARQTIPALMEDLGYPCELIDGDQPVFRFIIQKTR